MADGVTADPGTGGATFGTDENTVKSWHVPLTKIQWGADGTFTDVTTSAPFPVEISDVNNTLVADIGNIETNTDFGAVVGGGVEATALRVTIASDSTGVLSVDDNGGALTVDNGGTFAVQVDAALPSGTNAIGKLAANSGVDIGDVDVLTIANMHSADYDSDVGTDTTLAVGIAVPAAGGAAVVPGDATAGLKVDLGADNDVTLATLPDTATSDLAGIRTALEIIDDWDETNRAAVNLIASQVGITGGAGAVGASTPRVTLASDDPAVALLGTIDSDTSSLAGCVGGAEVQVDVVASLPTGANLIGDVGIQGRATGGLSTFRSIDLDETEEEVKATAGTVYSVVALNLTAAPLYLKLYNATAATVVVGSTTPLITIPIPANADSDGAGFVLNVPQGIAFGTAITAAVTTGVADADTGAPGANEAVVNIFYA